MKRNAKLLAIGFGALFLFSFRKKAIVISNNITIQSPVDYTEIRPCDAAGCGSFNAPRGSRTHNGIDLVVLPNKTIYAPITGTVRPLYVYSSSTEMKGVEITNKNVKVKMFYVDSPLILNDFVVKGSVIGVSQDIAAYHNSSTMTPHIHVEIYVDNQLTDPTKYFI